MSQFPTSLYYMFPIINLVIALYKVNTHTLKLCLCHQQWSTSQMREKLQWHHLGLFGQARQSHRHYCKTVFSVQITLIYWPWKKKNQCCSPFHFNKCHIFEQACCHSCNYVQVKKKRKKETEMSMIMTTLSERGIFSECLLFGRDPQSSHVCC